MAARRGSFLEIGGKFGIYDVVRELGRGGMGAVYLVRNPATGDELAAKVMYPDSQAARGNSVRRFIREAELAMKVEHPNLIRVYDIGRDPDTNLAYMLMDYMPGGSLRMWLKRRQEEGVGPFPIGEALAIVRAVADALEAAAAHGVVHRDVKPDNILFAADGRPCLADLGVAKSMGGDITTTTLTMDNMIVGSPAYMAPEQMTNAHKVDARADIYSLGIVLWELLAGERPLAGASASELMARAIRADRIPDIQARRKGLPAGVVELVRRMTEPDAARRFASPGEVVRFIDEWREWERKRVRRWLFGSLSVGVALALAVLCGGIWYISCSVPERQMPSLDVKIRTAHAPTFSELAARAEVKAREAEEMEKARKKKEVLSPATNAATSVQVIPAPAEPALPKAEEPKPSAPAEPVEQKVETKPSAPPVPSETKGETIEELVALFGKLAADGSGEGCKQIDAAVNEARRISPDLSAFGPDGKLRDEYRTLTEADAAICRKGLIFLRLELFRRQKGRLPSAAEEMHGIFP